MEVCYVVTFKPQEVRAYAAELVVVTEREKFIVPVGALGHRAALDFPDQASKHPAFAPRGRLVCLLHSWAGTKCREDAAERAERLLLSVLTKRYRSKKPSWRWH